MDLIKQVALLFVTMMVLPLATIPSSAANDPPAGGGNVTGDWTVTDVRTFTGVTINVAGNVIIASTGTLTLNNVNLNINGASNGQYALTVQGSGKMYTSNNTNITSSNSNNFRFVINLGAIVDLKNTTISKCGLAGGVTGRGIFIGSDNVLMDGCTVSNSFEGIHIEYASPKIYNTTFSGNQYYAVYGDHTYATIDRCNIVNNGHYGGAASVLVENSNSTTGVFRLSNSTIKDNEHGVYFNSDSPGLFENNTLSNSTQRGLWVRLCSPTIRNNSITGNDENGIYLEDSNSLIEHNNITTSGTSGLPRSGIYVFAASASCSPLIQYNYIAANTDTGIHVRANTNPVIRYNNITNQTNIGIRFNYCGPVQVYGNNVSYNYDGMVSQFSTPGIFDNILLGNQNDGLHAEGSFISFERNTVSASGMSGIHATAASRLTVGNSTFNGGNQWGVSADTNTTVLMVNCNFSDEFKEAFKADATSTTDWLVNGPAMIDGDDAVLRGNLTITSTGKLALSGVHMDINSNSVWRRTITQASGGEFSIDGCNLTAYDPAYNYRFSSAGKLTVRNSTLEEIGWVWGTDGETAGLYLSGNQVKFENSSVARNYYGLVMRNCAVVMTNSEITGCEMMAADEVSSVLDARNCTLDGASQNLLQLELSSRAEMLNTVFDQNKVNLKDGSSIVNVSWYFTVRIQWVNLDPAPGTTVNLTDSKGTRLFSQLTDLTGMTSPNVVLEYTQKSAAKTTYTPHTLNVSRDTMTTETGVNINRSLIFTFTFVDNTPPVLDITSPANLTSQNSRTVELRGTARDIDSGIAKVDVCWNNFNWLPAFTADNWTNWNYTFDLYDGSYTLKVRAANFAGGMSFANLTVSIDNTVPFLFVDFPKESYLTNQTNLTVAGKTERNATVTVNVSGLQETEVTNDNGTFSGTVRLFEGENRLLFRTTDRAGNINQTQRNVTLDTIAPWIRTELPRISYTGGQSVAINGTTDGTYVTVNGQMAQLNNGSFTKTVILNTGVGTTNTTVTVVSRDDALNLNSTVLYVLKDNTAPTITLDSPRDNTLTTGTTIYVNGTTEPGAKVTVNGINILIDAAGNFSSVFELKEGTNVMTIETTDGAGNMRRSIRTVNRDSTPPVLTVSSPTDGSRTQETEINVMGTTEPGAKVTVNGEEILPGIDGLFTRVRFWLQIGNNEIVVNATDAAGNRASVTVKVTRDDLPPPPPPPPPVVTPKTNLDQMIPMILLLVIIIGGVGAGAYIYKSSGSSQTAAGTRPAPGAPGGIRRQQGPQRMRTPTEMAIARKEGLKETDRPRSADDLYGKDYASKKPGVDPYAGYEESGYRYSAPKRPENSAGFPDPNQTSRASEPAWEPEPAPVQAQTKTWQLPPAQEEYVPETPAVPETYSSSAEPATPAEPDIPAPAPSEPEHDHTAVDSEIDRLLRGIGDVSQKKK